MSNKISPKKLKQINFNSNKLSPSLDSEKEDELKGLNKHRQEKVLRIDTKINKSNQTLK